MDGQVYKRRSFRFTDGQFKFAHDITTELYRIKHSHPSALRMVRTKAPSTRPKFLLIVRYNFRTQVSAISPRDISAIEHLLRRGRRQIQVSEDPNVKDCWVSQEMKDWEAKQRRA